MTEHYDKAFNVSFQGQERYCGRSSFDYGLNIEVLPHSELMGLYRNVPDFILAFCLGSLDEPVLWRPPIMLQHRPVSKSPRHRHSNSLPQYDAWETWWKNWHNSVYSHCTATNRFRCLLHSRKYRTSSGSYVQSLRLYFTFLAPFCLIWYQATITIIHVVPRGRVTETVFTIKS